MARRAKKNKNAPKLPRIPQIPRIEDPRKIYPAILWSMAAGAWLLVAVALASHDAADPLPAGTAGVLVWPPHDYVSNLVGRFGALLSHKVYHMFGPGVWIAMAGCAALMVAAAMKKHITQLGMRVIGVAIMTIVTSAIVAPTLLPPGSLHGLMADALGNLLRDRFNSFGAMLILIIGFWIGAVLAMDQMVIALSRHLGRWIMALRHVRVPKPVLVGKLGYLFSGSGVGLSGGGGGGSGSGSGATTMIRSRRGASSPGMVDISGGKGKAGKRTEDDAALLVGTALADEEDSSPEVEGEIDESSDAAEKAEATDKAEAPTDDPAESGGSDAPGAYVAEKKFDPDALREKIKRLQINFGPSAKGGSGAKTNVVAKEMDISGYRFPGLDLLVEPESNFTKDMERMIHEQAVQLESALQQYRIDGQVVDIDSGPVITLFEVRLRAGTKVSTVGAVASDLARSLKAHNIRIVPNTVGKDTVGIEVPNLKKERVRLKELMTAAGDTTAKMKLPMFLGKDASGNPLIADLTEMPHMLLAGTTGSGKSVCMNSIIMSFLFTKRPDELKMVLVDPKMVELSMFKDVPHLMCPVVTEMPKAAAILEWATTKMDERYELLAEAGVRDIAGYNNLTAAELKERFNPSSEVEEARIPKKLPYLVFIIDELADLIITNKEVEGFIVRLAQKARAVGLHLILATQRPQANVVTGLIKGNMPCRISFKVASGLDSRIVLDQKGAELLLGQGDMLYLSPRSSKLTRAQGTLVDDLEIRRTVTFLKEIAEQNFEPQLIQLRNNAAEEDEEEETERDPLFDDAVRVVLETKRGSVSLLQRRLTIGYARASRLIEQMARAGMLGEYKGSQAREVTMTLEEYEALKAQAEADAQSAAAQGPVFEDSAGDAKGKSGGGGAAESGANWANEGDDDDDSVPNEMDDEYRR